MPARKITINGVSDSFKWQAGNTKRFIKFNAVTDVEYKEYCSMFDVYCGQNIVRVPNELREQFKAKYEEWKKTKMKEYKVGDTIYVKGTIVDSDCAQQYLIKPGDYTYGFWFKRDAIADLPEPVKPVLPKDVADELERAKKSRFSFDGYIMKIISGNAAYYNSREFWFNSSDGVIKTLMDAWNNGYTVEEEKYNLVIGTDSRNNRVCVYHIADETRIDGFTIESDLDSSQYQFTQSEIDKYNKDFWIKNIDLNDYKVEVNDDDNED